MNVDAMGNIVASPVDFVILSGLDKNGKPYSMLKLDNQRGFDIGRNTVALNKLKVAGVRVFDKSPVAELAK